MLGLLPAGYLADRIGRLKVLSLSSIVIASSFLILILFRNFLFFSLAELLYGIGLALNSGTLIAYITDLQEQNHLSPNSKLMGMQVIILNLTTLIGGNIGTGLFAIADTAPVWFALIGLGLYPAFIFFMIQFLSFSDNKAAYKRKNNNIKNIANFFKKRNFWILLLLNVGYDCGTQFILIYWSIIYVKKLGFNLSLVYTLFMCALILGSLIFNRISTFASSMKNVRESPYFNAGRDSTAPARLRGLFFVLFFFWIRLAIFFGIVNLVVDVLLHSFFAHVADTTEIVARAPQMPSPHF